MAVQVQWKNLHMFTNNIQTVNIHKRQTMNILAGFYIISDS